jgi:phosphoribosyl 1,2-cyclic phosphate phosphodiesterase
VELTILGSGGCMVIPKPFCRCTVCEEARVKGAPYARTGPSLFIHDENILIDTPAEIVHQLNRSRIDRVDRLMFTHLDPDHTEGFRVVEQITLDFRTWRAFPGKHVRLVLPRFLQGQLQDIRSPYGPLIDYYESRGFVRSFPFSDRTEIGNLRVTAIPVDRGDTKSFIYVFDSKDRRLVYAPCDIRPFPEKRDEVQGADLLVIQPGIFEEGLRHGFRYPEDHVSRTTLYTFEETLALAERIRAEKVLFTHLEEYWNRSHDDYLALQENFKNVQFAYDGMRVPL